MDNKKQNKMSSEKRLKMAEIHAVQQSGIEKIDRYLKEMHNLKNMPEQISQEDNVYINKVFSEKQLSIEDYKIRGLKCSKLKLSKEERLRVIDSILKGYQKAEQRSEKNTETIYDEKKSYGRGDYWLKQRAQQS